jgi:hypothetical protein
MDRDGQAPRLVSDIKHGKMAVVGLAGHIWPISNTPLTAWRGRSNRPGVSRSKFCFTVFSSVSLFALIRGASG